MSERINLAETFNNWSRDYARKLADYKDAAVYAYVKGAFDAITKRGDNPEDFELLFISGELEVTEPSVYKINQRIRVRRFQ